MAPGTSIAGDATATATVTATAASSLVNRHRWPDSSKVYTRKIHKNPKSKPQPPPPPPRPPPSPPKPSTVGDDVAVVAPSVPPAEDDVAPSLPPPMDDVAATTSPADAAATTSPADASSSLNNRHQEEEEDSEFVKICLRSKSKDEILELREKFAGELEQVRTFLREIESRYGVSGGGGGGESTQSQHSVAPEMDGNGMIEGFEEEEPKNNGVIEVVNEEPMVNYGHLNGNGVIEGFDNYGHLNGNGVIEGFDNYGHLNGSGVIEGFQNEQQDGEPVLKYGHLNGNGVIEGFESEQRVPKYRKLSVSVAPEINSSLIGGVFEKEKRTPKANQLYQNSDFILIGKDKFPPPEFSNSGSKKKLRTNGKINSFLEKRYSHVFKKCATLLSKLMKHKFGWVFNKPVDVKALGLHDYYSIIRHPMDLGTVKSRLNKNWYKTPAEFAEDVRLTFRNAMTYNPKGQDVHIMAQQLSQIFEEQWPAIEAEYAYVPYPPTPVPRRPMPFDGRMLERSDSTVYPVEAKTKPVNYPAPIVHHIVRPTVVRQPKPKAKDLYKREMTAEEKQKLNGHLQALPAEKLDGVVQIIRKRNSVLCPQEDEIEIDIDLLDTETLWELDRFVTNYKKSLSKHKRRAELAMLAKAKAERERGQERVMELGIVGEPIGNTTGGKGVASSLQIGGENKREDSSGSSSSSSSSSDSGSSSSDSDSDSSSESDTGH